MDIITAPDHRPRVHARPQTVPWSHPQLPTAVGPPLPDLSRPGRTEAAKLARVIVEVWAGQRPLLAVTSLVDKLSLRHLADVVPPTPDTTTTLRLASLRTQPSGPDVVEVTARVTSWQHAHASACYAMAFRAIHVARGWTCTALQIHTQLRRK